MKHITGLKITLFLSFVVLISCGNNGSASNKESATLDGSEIELVEGVSMLDELSTNPSKVVSEKAFKVSGQVVGMPNSLVVLNELTTQKINFIDSTRTNDKGEFEFAVESESLRIGYISVNSVKPPGVPLVLQNGEKVKIEIRMGRFIETVVKGGYHNTEMKKLYDLYMGHNVNNGAFQERIQGLDPRTVGDSMKRAVNIEYEAMNKIHEQEVWDFIKQSPTSGATYFAATFIIQQPNMSMLDDALGKLQKDLPEEAILLQFLKDAFQDP